MIELTFHLQVHPCFPSKRFGSSQHPKRSIFLETVPRMTKWRQPRRSKSLAPKKTYIYYVRICFVKKLLLMRQNCLSCYANNMQSCSSTMNMMHDARERDMTTPFRSSRPCAFKITYTVNQQAYDENIQRYHFHSLVSMKTR